VFERRKQGNRPNEEAWTTNSCKHGSNETLYKEAEGAPLRPSLIESLAGLEKKRKLMAEFSVRLKSTSYGRSKLGEERIRKKDAPPTSLVNEGDEKVQRLVWFFACHLREELVGGCFAPLMF